MKHLFLVTTVSALCLIAVTAPAEQKTTLAGGLTLTDGNSETLQANVNLASEHKLTDSWTAEFGVDANYGESATDAGPKEKTVENAKLSLNVKHLLGEDLFAYLDGSVFSDAFADIDYRTVIGPGLGITLFKNDSATIAIELGASYLFNKIAGETDDFVAIRAQERISYKLSETAHLWQKAEVLPQIDDFDNYLINAEIGVEAAVTSTLNLRVMLQDKYVSNPAPGLEENDVSLITGISVSL